MEKLKQLYQEVILRHDRDPVHFEKWEAAPLVLEAYNQLCGDQFRLYLEVKGGMVKRAAFHGYGCAISKAATSVLVSKIEGKSLNFIRSLGATYLQLTDPEKVLPLDLDPELEAFAGARQFPARRACATLSWERLLLFLEENEK